MVLQKNYAQNKVKGSLYLGLVGVIIKRNGLVKYFSTKLKNISMNLVDKNDLFPSFLRIYFFEMGVRDFPS